MPRYPDRIGFQEMVLRHNPLIFQRFRGTGAVNLIPGDTLAPIVRGAFSSTPCDLTEIESAADNTGMRFTNATTTPTNYLELPSSIDAAISGLGLSSWAAHVRFRLPLSSQGKGVVVCGNVGWAFAVGMSSNYATDSNAVSFFMRDATQSAFGRSINASINNMITYGEWNHVAFGYHATSSNRFNPGLNGDLWMTINGHPANTDLYTFISTLNQSGNFGTTPTALSAVSRFCIGCLGDTGNARFQRTAPTDVDVAYFAITRDRVGISEDLESTRQISLASIGDKDEYVINADVLAPVLDIAKTAIVPVAFDGDSTAIQALGTAETGWIMSTASAVAWDDTAKTLTIPQTLLDSGYRPRVGGTILVSGPTALLTATGGASGPPIVNGRMEITAVSGRVLTCTRTTVNATAGAAIVAGGNQTQVTGFLCEPLGPVSRLDQIGNYGAAIRAFSERFECAGVGYKSLASPGSAGGEFYDGIRTTSPGTGGETTHANKGAAVRDFVIDASRTVFAGGSWDNSAAKTLTIPKAGLSASVVPIPGDWINITASDLSPLNYIAVAANGVADGGANWVLTCVQTNGTAINIGNQTGTVAGAFGNSSAIPLSAWYLASGQTLAATVDSQDTFVPENLPFDAAQAMTFRFTVLGSTNAGSGRLQLRLGLGATDLGSLDIATNGPAPAGALVSGTDWMHRVSFTVPAAVRSAGGVYQIRVNGTEDGAGSAIGPAGVARFAVHRTGGKGLWFHPIWFGGGLTTLVADEMFRMMPIAAMTEWLRDITQPTFEQTGFRPVIFLRCNGRNSAGSSVTNPPSVDYSPVNASSYEGEIQQQLAYYNRWDAAYAPLGQDPKHLVFVDTYHASGGFSATRGIKDRARRFVAAQRRGQNVSQVVVVRQAEISGFYDAIEDRSIAPSDSAHPRLAHYRRVWPITVDAMIQAIELATGSSGDTVRSLRNRRSIP